ncbi:VQ motif-containing protein 17-like [Sesamum indicum]|uniref:VQ motif-containing protein 17-like n=1 Tax=Sesamum indicum TaxID=4182 RepID=A0A6I9T500_SESIN|nr:VQ motif-containing protein 17-like [Sesamum indicum]
MKRLSAQETAAAVSPDMHNNSQRSRRKPKIRIIHIFAPEIIKTDAANFRELVQRLTGNPIKSHHNICSTKKIRSTSRRVPTRQEPRIFVSDRKRELGVREMRNIKGDDQEEVCGGGNTVFAEFDGLMKEIGDHHDDEFPFMDLQLV